MESLNKLLVPCFAFSLLLYLPGCGSIAGAIGGGPNLTITAQAQSTSLQAGQADLLSATVMHAGGNPAVTWSISGSTCPNSCGALSTVNGETYTSPSFVPATFMVSVTATAVADPSKSASVTLTVNQSLSVDCPTGNEAALAGQYAFLLRGGGSAGGVTTTGSITADGKGNITAGLEDINSNSAGPQTGLTLPAGQSLYTVGPDNRGCLGLVNSQNALNIYRFGLSSVSGGVATAGRMIEFDDTTGNGTRAEGFLAQQDSASFLTSAIHGDYVFGLAGGDSTGGRYASAGVLTANAGAFSNGNMDSDDAGVLGTNITGISGAYSVASSGRGTLSLSPGGGQNFILYMISASRFIAMSSDALDSSHPLQSGQVELQSGALNNAALNAPSVLGLTSFDDSSAAPGAAVGVFTPDGNGNATQVLDVNAGGTYTPLQSSVLTYSVGLNGRVTISGIAQPPVFYLSAANRGFVVGTDAPATFGTFEPQSGGPFSNASLSGTYTYGTEGAAVGSRLTAVGSTTFDGTQNVQGTEDDSSPAGLLANNPTSNAQYSFLSNSLPPGRGTLDTSNNVNPSVAYIVSPTKLIYINPPATKPRLVVVEK